MAAVVILVVVAILALVVYTLFELTPLASHAEKFRDPVTHKRLFDSPHLETRDEFERREHKVA